MNSLSIYCMCIFMIMSNLTSEFSLSVSICLFSSGQVHGGFLILYGSRLLNVSEFFKGLRVILCYIHVHVH